MMNPAPRLPDQTPAHLFVYGTLGPATLEHAAHGGFVPDRLRGSLYHLGPYPGLVGLDDPTAPWVEGHVRPVTESELLNVLDPYEGVHEALFLRVAAYTERGQFVWVYLFARALPAWATGPHIRWDGQRIDPLKAPRPDLPDT